MSDATPATEEQNPQSRDLDLRTTEELVALIVADQERAVQAVSRAAASIARVVDAVAERLERGGRLHYVGAGTSGRLGVLDASEIPPTFGAPPDLVCAHIAGDDAALRTAVEGAEDDGDAGALAMERCISVDDVARGISARGGASSVVGALAAARRRGAYTAAFVNVAGSAVARAAGDAVMLDTGAEVIAGSTRLKAGTAQKIALNAFSTAVMIRLGKVYDNMMVDVVASNAKLRLRARRLVESLAGLEPDAAQSALDAAGGRVKRAVVMVRRGVDVDEADAQLAREHGALRPFL